MQDKVVIPSNEWDEIVSIYKKYKKFVWAGVVLGTVMTLLYVSLIFKPVYLATNLIQIGKKNTIFIEPLATVTAKLEAEYKISDSITGFLPRMSKIKTIDRGQGIIRLYAQGDDKKTLRELLTKMADKVVSENNVILENYKSTYAKHLENATKITDKTKAKLKAIQIKLDKGSKTLDNLVKTDQAGINFHMLKMLRNDIVYVRASKELADETARIKSYNTVLMETRTYPTKQLGKIDMHDKPVTSSRVFIISVGIVGSLIFSLLLAFLFDLVTKRRD